MWQVARSCAIPCQLAAPSIANIAGYSFQYISLSASFTEDDQSSGVGKTSYITDSYISFKNSERIKSPCKAVSRYPV